MTENVYWLLELAINPDRFEDFKNLMAEMVEATQRNEAGALDYEWTISDDRQVCHLYERYQDSAAAMTHLESFGANFAARFMEVLKPTRLSSPAFTSSFPHSSSFFDVRPELLVFS